MNWAKTKQSRTLEFIPLSLNRVWLSCRISIFAATSSFEIFLKYLLPKIKELFLQAFNNEIFSQTVFNRICLPACSLR